MEDSWLATGAGQSGHNHKLDILLLYLYWWWHGDKSNSFVAVEYIYKKEQKLWL